MKNKKYYICPNCTNVFYIDNKSEYVYKTKSTYLCSYKCKKEYIINKKIMKKTKLGEQYEKCKKN